MLVPVILSGGAGTRLWPVSRAGHPKPFMKLADGQTLLSKTYSRALGCSDVAEVLTITNRDYYFQSKDCWSSLNNTATGLRFLLEPAGRNTAPALLLGALKVKERYGEDAILLVLAADHLINDQAAFREDVVAATRLASQGYLVTFGIQPTSPETGFGYIRAGEPISAEGSRVKGFVEKPDLATAESMLTEGGFYWNSGMFCFSVKTLLLAFEQHMPKMLETGQACWATSSNSRTDSYCPIDETSFAEMEDISIDYAIMEKATNTAVIPATFDWSDIGSWNALGDLLVPDKNGNRTQGDVVHVDSRNCFIQSEERLVATIGLDDLIIVDTPDALLVSHKDSVQQVREVVGRLKAQGHESYRLHRTVARPWGTYTVLEESTRYKIKRIEVKPGASLSLQMHHHRSEHWIVVHGMAKVINGDQELFIKANESTYIKAGHQHRLENPGVIDLVMIEVQSGEYLGEDDIVRFEDSYGRA
tara:strand:- start:11555 stop:12979 length:1425 start_codon:yes stop_codon:yes gene_type:complete